MRCNDICFFEIFDNQIRQDGRIREGGTVVHPSDIQNNQKENGSNKTSGSDSKKTPTTSQQLCRRSLAKSIACFDKIGRKIVEEKKNTRKNRETGAANTKNLSFEIEQKVINDPQDEGETGTCNKKNDGFGKIGRKVVDEKKGKCEKTSASGKNRP